MIKIITLAIGFILVPSLTLAAPLTNDQAVSLIEVVQSSPDTPASAFINLITAFSDITDIQAESLITVVQAAPGVPANAFVSLLVAFTVDSNDIPNKSVVEFNNKIDSLDQKIGQIITNTMPQPVATPAPVPEPVKNLEVSTTFYEANSALPFGRYYFTITVTEDGKPSDKTVTVEWPADHDKPVDVGGTSLYSGGSDNTVKSRPDGVLSFGPYIPTTKGVKTVKFTAEGISKEVQVEVK